MLAAAVKVLGGMISKVVAAEAESTAATQLSNAINSAEQIDDSMEQIVPVIKDVTSTTWYARNLTDRNNWVKANNKWATLLDKELVRQYYERSRQLGNTSPVPILITTIGTRDGVSISCNSTMNKGFAGKVVKEAIVATVRGTLKAYVRSAAAGGADLPNDYEIEWEN